MPHEALYVRLPLGVVPTPFASAGCIDDSGSFLLTERRARASSPLAVFRGIIPRTCRAQRATSHKQTYTINTNICGKKKRTEICRKMLRDGRNRTRHQKYALFGARGVYSIEALEGIKY